jgi:uncharacterized protein YlxP (DUF503 family)
VDFISKGEIMYNGVMVLRIEIYDSFSLKDKRKVLKSIISKISSRFNVSISETGSNENHKRAEIGISSVSKDKVMIESAFTQIVNTFDADYRLEIYENDVYIEKY